MNQTGTTLHLWFKPYQGVLTETDVVFTNNYGKRFYPRVITKVAQELRNSASRITSKFKDLFEYQMRHYTYNERNRYVIEEALRDHTNEEGFALGIQNTNTEERKLFVEAFNAEKEQPGLKLSPVMSVVTYLQDSLFNEAHLWDNAKLHNGTSATDIAVELITFLKSVKNQVKVYDFKLTDSKDGRVLTLALVCPDTLSYYVRVDWIII